MVKITTDQIGRDKLTEIGAEMGSEVQSWVLGSHIDADLREPVAAAADYDRRVTES